MGKMKPGNCHYGTVPRENYISQRRFLEDTALSENLTAAKRKKPRKPRKPKRPQSKYQVTWKHRLKSSRRSKSVIEYKIFSHESDSQAREHARLVTLEKNLASKDPANPKGVWSIISISKII